MLTADVLPAHCQAVASTVLALSPMAARAHKKLFSELWGCVPQVKPVASDREETAITQALDPLTPYYYANHPEHREGIAAFLAKRNPKF